MNMRDEFERQYLREWPSLAVHSKALFTLDGQDEYAQRDVQSRWEGWQSAVKATARRCVEIVYNLRNYSETDVENAILKEFGLDE